MVNWGKALIIAAVSGLIVALGSYLLVVKENKVRIEGLQSTLEDLRDSSIKIQDSLTATKLFIVQAHPDRNASSLAAVMKLKNLNKAELATLAEGLRNIKIVGPNKEVHQASAEIQELMKKHNLTGKDFITYYRVAELPSPTKPSM